MMTTITVTPEILKQLKGLIGPIEFRDPTDRLLGSFQPSGEKLTYDQMLATCPFSEDELRLRSLDSEEGRPLADILRELEEKWPSNAPGQILDESELDGSVVITVTLGLLKRLHGLMKPMDFRDEKNRLLGSFQPAGGKPTYDQMMATCPYSDEELNTRSAVSPDEYRTTAEVLQELREKWPIE